MFLKVSHSKKYIKVAYHVKKWVIITFSRAGASQHNQETVRFLIQQSKFNSASRQILLTRWWQKNVWLWFIGITMNGTYWTIFLMSVLIFDTQDRPMDNGTSVGSTKPTKSKSYILLDCVKKTNVSWRNWPLQMTSDPLNLQQQLYKSTLASNDITPHESTPN